jgi:hypothetical protein
MGNGFKKTRLNTTYLALHNAINDSKKTKKQKLKPTQTNPFQAGEKIEPNQ